MEKVCFTGYRPAKLPFACTKNDSNYLKFLEKVKEIILNEIEHGKRYFLSGMAQGADIICAEIVLEFKFLYPDIFLECVLPFRNQNKAWSTSQKDWHSSVSEKADKITVVKEEYSEGCYMQRNKYMVDAASTVIAVFDGKKGGTKNTVDYAVKKNKEIIMLDPQTLSAAYIETLKV